MVCAVVGACNAPYDYMNVCVCVRMRVCVSVCVCYRMSRWVYVIRVVQPGSELIVLKRLQGRKLFPNLMHLLFHLPVDFQRAHLFQREINL